MNHPSGLDASYLHRETPEMPMHVGALQLPDLADGQVDFAVSIRRHGARRVRLSHYRQSAALAQVA